MPAADDYAEGGKIDLGYDGSNIKINIKHAKIDIGAYGHRHSATIPQIRVPNI